MKVKIVLIWSKVKTFFATYVSIGYLLNTPKENAFIYTIVGISVVLFLAGGAVKFLLPRWAWKLKERVYKKYINFFFKWTWGFGIFGLFFAFFGYEQTIYLGYRFCLYTWAITLLSWIYYSIFILRPRLLEDLKKHHKKKEKEKWMKK
jgi:hypothetical protein